MILESIKINNYKSFEKKDNILKFEQHVTVIIGKNESGKSNLLEIMSNLSLINGFKNNIFKNINRKYIKDKVSLSLDLSFTNNECKELGLTNETNVKTRFTFNEPNKVNIDGALSNYFDQNKISDLVKILKESCDKNYMKLDSNQIQILRNYITSLTNLNLSICNNYDSINNTIKTWCKNIKDDYIKNVLENTSQKLHDFIELAYSKFPVFHYYQEVKLKNSYWINDELIKNFNTPNNALKKLLLASKIELNEFRDSFSQDISTSEDTRESIIEKIKINLETKFNKFYTQERVKISPRFNNNYFSLMIKTSKNNMKLSERSNGLQWYLNLFIDILAHDLQNKNVIYLIDEPGVYLHVEAQKQLLSLFKDLTKTKNQLIYTTHSPYMLDNENIVQIRALEKIDSDTHIYNSVYALSQNSVSKMETLSPLLKVIGLDLKYNIGPSISKINLIVEGITDYMYFTAMMNYMNIDNFYIIPSIGAGNVSKIACILFGWGCNFKAILDCDTAGNNDAKKLENGLGLILNKDYFYVNGVSKFNNKISATIENLISEEDNEKLQCKYKKGKGEATKKLAAKSFYEMVKNKSLIPSQETENNFKHLFDLIQASISKPY